MRVLQVDAFTSEPFRGNPAGVCLIDGEREESWMQDVAAEMNCSATAFLLPGDEDFSLRWYSPTVELLLCGHGTLASAHVLWEEGLLHGDAQARFQTKAGVLTAKRNGDVIELDFPATREERVDAPPGLLEALDVSDPVYVGKNKFDYVVEVASEDEVRALAPNLAQLRTVPTRGVVVTSRGTDFDFVSRFFAPGAGIDEDSVTGSSHCCLAPYWASRLGKTAMHAYQASQRGGVVHVRLDGDRVTLGGRAVTVLRAELAV